MGLFGWLGRQSKQSDLERPKQTGNTLESRPPIAPSHAQQEEAVKVAEGSSFSAETSVFEFGSASSSDECITLAGYCPVSNELEPCRWEVLPSVDSKAPLFRIIF